MAGYSTTLRNARLDQISTAVGNAGLLRIYDGSRPATGGAATTLLAELTCGTPFAPAAAAGVLTANAVTADSSANASGTASWARITTSGGTFVMDLSLGTSGTEVVINSTTVTITGNVSCSSIVITAGSA